MENSSLEAIISMKCQSILPKNLRVNSTFLLIRIKKIYIAKKTQTPILARFAKFMIVHKNDPYMQDMIHEGLDRFIRHQLFQFDNAKDVPIHFVGSISLFPSKMKLNLILKEFGFNHGEYC